MKLLVHKSRRLDREFTARELRQVVRNLHALPTSTPLVIEVGRCRSWLSRPHRDVFDLYAMGYSLREIAQYWGRVTGREVAQSPNDAGNYVVTRMLKQLLWMMDRDETNN